MKALGNDSSDPSSAENEANVSAAGKVAIQYYHHSHQAKAGDNLLPDRLRFSFKKGSNGIKYYQHPVQITRVRTLVTQAVGFKDAAERGRAFDYFLAKRDGAAGL